MAVNTRIFKKHYFISSGIILLFFVVSLLTAHFVLEYDRKAFPNPGAFLSNLISQVQTLNRSELIEALKKESKRQGLFDFFLIAEDGRVIYPAGTVLPVDWETLEKPKEELQMGFLPPPKGMIPPPPPPGFGLGGRPGMPPFPPPGAFLSLIKLPPQPDVQYILVQFKPVRMERGLPPPLIAIGIILLAMILGVGVALLVLFRSLEKKSSIVDHVISDLQKGNLKARFPIQGKDEISQTMQRFNIMADEIEKLVNQLRDTEQSRNRLLQELAHDLRTPIASVKNFLESLSFQSEKMDRATQKDLLRLSIKEVDYFARLVDDLLLLARVSDNSYRKIESQMDLAVLLDDELEAVSQKYVGKVRFSLNHLEDRFLVSGDAHLLRRLFRNALENSFSFAKNEVTVEIKKELNHIEINFKDDGQGFSDEALRNFGERKLMQARHESKSGRVTIGLGSVIMKTITKSHGAELEVSNVLENGTIVGARLAIKFPLKG